MTWHPIEGWAGLYEVSDTGQVRSLPRTIRQSHGTSRLIPGCLMRPFENDKGYLVVRLSDGRRRKMVPVHRLVATAFVPNPSEFPEVNHLDGDKGNPAAANLEWTTPRGNRLHARDNGLLRYAKLCADTVRQLRDAAASGAPKRRIARDLGLSPKTIRQAVSGETWANLPPPPEKSE